MYRREGLRGVHFGAAPLQPRLAQLVLWRAEALLCDVNRVASISRRGNGGEVNIRWLGEVEVPVMLASRDVKLAFFEVLRQSRPDVAIYRKS